MIFRSRGKDSEYENMDSDICTEDDDDVIKDKSSDQRISDQRDLEKRISDQRDSEQREIDEFEEEERKILALETQVTVVSTGLF